MPRPFIPLTIQQFASLVAKFDFSKRPIKEIHVHGTWRPNHSQDKGLSTIESMYTYHTQTKGWSDIGQHITIDSHGTIWTGRSWTVDPASAAGHNRNVFMFEMVGDFDIGRDRLTDPQRLSAYLVTAYLLRKCNLNIENVRFHNEFTDQKTCPGTSISLEDFRKNVLKQFQNLSMGQLDVLAKNEASGFNTPFFSSENLEAALRVEGMLLDFLTIAGGSVSEPEADADCGYDAYDANPELLSADMRATGDPGNSEFDLPAAMFRSGIDPQTTTVGMFKDLAGIVNTDVRYTLIDGKALFEGDIVLANDQDLNEDTISSKGIGIAGEHFRWPGGKVSFVIADPTLEDTVRRAIQHWEQMTPIRFKQLVKPGKDEDYISFERQNGCWSSVGRQGGKQVISLGNGCGLGSAIHEIGHALGLWHEQSRSDRDQYIKIVWDNIDPAYRHNFDRHIQDGMDLGGYDYRSIMHYPGTAFAKDRTKPTILTAGGQDIGQRNGLSSGDINAIRMLYPELAWTSYTEPGQLNTAGEETNRE